jgi:polar amino acid transport system substrate-binding protein
MFQFIRCLFVLVLVSGCVSTSVAPPAAVADLASSGRLRAGINFGNPVLVQKNPATDAPTGLAVDLAHELGRRLGMPVELVIFDAAGKMADAMKSGAWEPKRIRSTGMSFTRVSSAASVSSMAISTQTSPALVRR